MPQPADSATPPGEGGEGADNLDEVSSPRIVAPRGREVKPRGAHDPPEPILPQDLQAEQATLGSILLEPAAAALALGLLEPRDFYPEHHQRIFRAMQSVLARHEPVDLITVKDELARMGVFEQVGGAEYLAALINTVPTAAHVGRYATLVAEKSVLRRLGLVGADLQEAVGRPDADLQTVLQRAQRHLAEIGERTGQADATCGLDVVASRIATTAWLWPGRLPLGYLTVLAGETGAGKSTTALHFVGATLGQWPWPDGSAPEIISETVLWVESESRQGMLAGRARGWSLPLERIRLPGVDGFDEVDLGAPNAAAQLGRLAAKAKARLVVVDSLSGAHGLDENSSAMRLLLKDFTTLARDQQLAILPLHHVRKRQMGEGPEITLDRVRGSSTLVQLAVSVLGQDCPAGEAAGTARRLLCLKSNLCEEKPPALGVTLSGGFPLFGAEAPERPIAEGTADRAARFLTEQLEGGPRMARELYLAGEARGLNEKALKRARLALNLRVYKDGAAWWWAEPW